MAWRAVMGTMLMGVEVCTWWIHAKDFATDIVEVFEIVDLVRGWLIIGVQGFS
jgi:hypothetical protein